MGAWVNGVSKVYKTNDKPYFKLDDSEIDQDVGDVGNPLLIWLSTGF